MEADVDSIPYGYCHCGCGELTTIPTKTNRGNGRIKGVPMRYVNGHYRRKTFGPRYIEVDCGYTSPCWLWQSYITRSGYALRRKDGKTQPAHRIMYEEHIGPIPEDMDLHHLCADYGGPRHCVNPSHLQPVTTKNHIWISSGRKLDYDTAEDIRHLHFVEGYKQKTLAEIHDVHEETIGRIIRGVLWTKD